MGIQLALRDNPDKAFGHSKRGTVFVVYYNTVSWTWGLLPEKQAGFCLQARSIMGADAVRQDEIQSVVGRFIHI